VQHEIPACSDSWLTASYILRTVEAVQAIHIVSYKWLDDEGEIMTDTRWRGWSDRGIFRDVIYSIGGAMRGKGITWMFPNKTVWIQAMDQELPESLCHHLGIS
jgi:hypothetical protein